MKNQTIEQILGNIPKLDEAGETLSHTVHQWVLQGGAPMRKLADLLHGTWLGHPLHAILTDVAVGAWSLGALFDLLSFWNRSPQTEETADALTAAGNYAALPTILSGLADYSTIPKSATGMGLAHAGFNSVGYVLQLASARARKNGNRGRAVALTALAMFFLVVGAWLGGHLVYDKKVGVNRAEAAEKPTQWKAVLDAETVREGEPQRVEVEGNPVLLYRHKGTLHAIGAVCPHAGAPLEEGTFLDGCVQCPWHDSVFDLSNGRVVHGPSTYPVADYDARIHNGQVEVRIASASA